MTMCRMRMMHGTLGIAGTMLTGCFLVVTRRILVMIGGVLVMLRWVSHDLLLLVGCDVSVNRSMQ